MYIYTYPYPYTYNLTYLMNHSLCNEYINASMYTYTVKSAVPPAIYHFLYVLII